MRIRFAVESWILEKWCTAVNLTTFVRNLLGAFGISSSYAATPAPFGT
jgi:fluoride ion exporter CrcB/FEX